MREQRKNDSNRELTWRIYDTPIDELKFTTDDNIQRWMSEVKQADI